MSNELQNFTNQAFGTIRAVEIDGKPMFCAKDVAVALGYQNTNDAITKHCHGVAICYPIVDSLGREQDARFISEGDMYRLAASSKLEGAQEFESWIFDEVIPSIRKRGMYATPQTVEQILADPDVLIKALQDLKTERAANAELMNKNQEMAPKALFADAVSSSHTSILVGDLAKILKGNGIEIGQKRLFDKLRTEGYLIKSGSSKNMPTQKSMDLGLMEIKEGSYINGNGDNITTKTTKITGKGQIYFVNRFCAEGGGDHAAN